MKDRLQVVPITPVRKQPIIQDFQGAYICMSISSFNILESRQNRHQLPEIKTCKGLCNSFALISGPPPREGAGPVAPNEQRGTCLSLNSFFTLM